MSIKDRNFEFRDGDLNDFVGGVVEIVLRVLRLGVDVEYFDFNVFY